MPAHRFATSLPSGPPLHSRRLKPCDSRRAIYKALRPTSSLPEPESRRRSFTRSQRQLPLPFGGQSSRPAAFNSTLSRFPDSFDFRLLRSALVFEASRGVINTRNPFSVPPALRHCACFRSPLPFWPFGQPDQSVLPFISPRTRRRSPFPNLFGNRSFSVAGFGKVPSFPGGSRLLLQRL
jgi:hypothetical protein